MSPPADLPAGARVVLALPSGDRLAELLLGCLDRELVAVPLDPRTPPSRVAEVVRRVRASAVITPGGVETTGLPHEHPDADGLALIMFTSGSTGVPKGVMLPRAAVLGNAAKTAALHGFAPDRPHATCLPLYHCNALVMSLVGTRTTGTPLVLHPGFDPAAYFADLRAKEVRTASIVPAMLPDLLDSAPPWPESLDYLITAAAPLTADLARRFHARYGPRLRQGYGLTELVNFSFTTPHPGPEHWVAEYLDHYPPVGAPLPGTELRLEAGEVWIRSADRMRGYWEDREATAAALTPDGWLRTGDLGARRGDLLVLTGRRSERIERGGEKHYPLEVERTWREAGLPGRFAAVPVPDDTLGHEIGLVTADTDAGTIAAARAIAENGPLRPAALAFGAFTATATGKPQRTAMGRALAAGRENPSRWNRALDPGGTATLRAAAQAARARLADEVVRRLDHTGPVRVADPADPRRAPGELLVVPHGPGPGRWDLVEALRADADAVGTSALRAGRHDLGGVVWAR
ncbi:class I adenylate-forming enzyme family protein [Actinokineospora spheciospongiae]|uniref:class I adenylate-forming enzyme family protein n=2 Tax=Actinokineospora TaxID=39845 RepID=UPI000D9414CF|nr:class I adenylate-forming enzyme family protein [Actinokineospora spheciospongiae]PWW63610.1 acyl-CoA synthetase (AMP-forming)/AMP-acid ligase II [Actinokineospora spheciospongiae]